MSKKAIIAAAGSLALISGLISTSSTAAFTGSTTNPGNAWTAGSVSISDSASGTAMFTQSGLVPGDTGSRCLVVTYGGDVAADVRLSASVTGGTGLDGYLDLVVDAGTGSAADCSDFAVSAPGLFTGTLATMATANAGFATGVDTWAPTGVGQTRTYRFTWTLQDDNNAQGLTTQAGFTWEARNS